MGFTSALKNEVKKLSPAYFTLAMSTGMVSLGAHLLHLPLISEYLFWATNIVYGILSLLFLARALFFFKNFISDLTSFKKGAGLFSFVAATGLLGVLYVQVKHNYAPAITLFWICVVAWVLLLYTFFLSVTTKSDKPSLEKGINGIWLLMVVATQAVSILGTTLVKHLPFSPEQVLFFTLSAFSLGIMLYIIIITLIFYRLTFFPTTPKEISPPYWINEGAVGITALAGATFIQKISGATGFTGMVPFLEGISILAWATATWWIPIIVLLEVWKYLIKKVSPAYTPKYWSLVFCLGGYAVATFKLSKSLKLPFMQAIPEPFFYVALILWAFILVWMLFSMIQRLTSRTSGSAAQHTMEA